jgi:hypothetical protein
LSNHRTIGFNSRTDFLSPCFCPRSQSCWKNGNASLGMPLLAPKIPDTHIQLDTGRRRSRVLKSFDNRENAEPMARLVQGEK